MNLKGVPDDLKHAIDELRGAHYGLVDSALSKDTDVPTLINVLESHSNGQPIAPDLLGVLQKIATFRAQHPGWHRTE